MVLHPSRVRYAAGSANSSRVLKTDGVVLSSMDTFLGIPISRLDLRRAMVQSLPRLLADWNWHNNKTHHESPIHCLGRPPLPQRRPPRRCARSARAAECPGPAGRPHDAPAGRVGDADRVRLCRRHLGGGEDAAAWRCGSARPKARSPSRASRRTARCWPSPAITTATRTFT